MKVYRIEDKNGWGPYSSCYMMDWEHPREVVLCRLQEAHSRDPLRPSPYTNGEPWEDYYSSSKDMVFGFASLQELYNWFNGFVEDLINVGFYIKTFEVPNNQVKLGRLQLAFKRPE